jgi:5'-nucleotidase (lipoprotein e(P4) family)
MRKLYYSIGILMLLIVVTGCDSNNIDNPEVAEEKAVVSNPGLNTVLWHQTAAEYKALCYQTYHFAKIQLVSKLQKHAFPYEKAPAIIMDLDETVVDNSFYNAQLIKDGENYSKETWKNWSDLSQAGEVPGAIEFIKFARENGVTVIFISNRRINELDNTMKNLLDLGLTTLDTNHFFLRVDESSKAGRRSQVAENYEVLMLFGDNLADFTEMFDKKSVNERNELTESMQSKFGDSFIVLPNTLYGEWDGALFDYKYDWTTAQKDSIRREWIKGY